MISEERLRTVDGVVYSTGSGKYEFWTRYLTNFDSVRIIARLQEAEAVAPQWQIANGPGVEFRGLPYYLGPVQFARARRQILSSARDGVGAEGAVILRCPSPVGFALAKGFREQGRPYGVEVVGDPWMALGPGTVRHPLRPFLRRMLTRSLKQTCAGAAAAAYVTAAQLQERYPASSTAYSTSYSSIQLGPEAIVENVPERGAPTPYRIAVLGSLAQMYKGPDVLLAALRRVRAQGLNAELEWLGDGIHLDEMRQLADTLGLGDAVKFVGHVPAGDAVRGYLDRANLFVLPSRTEGLPRAVIEAMARGLPVVASRVGGIPELLADEDMVPASDPAALAEAILGMANDPVRARKAAERNLKRSLQYASAELDRRRAGFYGALRDVTAAWNGEGR